MNGDNTVSLKLKIDTSEIAKATQKAERLNELLKEASSIVGELASMGEIVLPVDIKG